MANAVNNANITPPQRATFNTARSFVLVSGFFIGDFEFRFHGFILFHSTLELRNFPDAIFLYKFHGEGDDLAINRLLEVILRRVFPDVSRRQCSNLADG